MTYTYRKHLKIYGERFALIIIQNLLFLLYVYVFTHEYNRHIGTVRFEFRMPFTRYIFEGTTSAYGETDQETVSLQKRRMIARMYVHQHIRRDDFFRRIFVKRLIFSKLETLKTLELSRTFGYDNGLSRS